MKETKLKKKLKAVFFRKKNVFNPPMKEKQYKHIELNIPKKPNCPECK